MLYINLKNIIFIKKIKIFTYILEKKNEQIENVFKFSFDLSILIAILFKLFIKMIANFICYTKNKNDNNFYNYIFISL